MLLILARFIAFDMIIEQGSVVSKTAMGKEGKNEERVNSRAGVPKLRYEPKIVGANWRELAQAVRMARPVPVQIRSLGFSPDGAKLAAGGLEARLAVWHLAELRQRLAEFDLAWDSPPPASPAR